ncbi:MAG: cyclic nucleotide-binding domain-containing protein [Pseudomonadota bacterium]
MTVELVITAVFFTANIIYCIAYAVRDILWLRILTIIAAACTYPYFYLQAEPLWSAIFWQSAFLIINLINVIFLWSERRPVDLTEEQSRLHSMVFNGFTPRQMIKLLEVGQVKTLEAGEKLLHRNQQNEKLYLIMSGLLEVRSENKGAIAYLKDGTFAGELSYMTGNPASADVVALEDTSYFHWNGTDLQKFLSKNEHYRRLLGSLLSSDMVDKLYSTTGSNPAEKS